MSKSKKVDNNYPCMFADMCKNFDNDYAKNENRMSFDEPYFCKNCVPFKELDNSGERYVCQNFDLKNKVIKNVNSEITKDICSKNESYNIVNNPAHYTKDRLFEPAWVINDWDLSWDLGTCVNYISRLGRKDDASKDIRKAFWYLVHEIALHNKDISKEELIETIDFIYNKEKVFNKDFKENKKSKEFVRTDPIIVGVYESEEKLLQDKNINPRKGDLAIVRNKEGSCDFYVYYSEKWEFLKRSDFNIKRVEEHNALFQFH